MKFRIICPNCEKHLEVEKTEDEESILQVLKMGTPEIIKGWLIEELQLLEEENFIKFLEDISPYLGIFLTTQKMKDKKNGKEAST